MVFHAERKHTIRKLFNDKTSIVEMISMASENDNDYALLKKWCTPFANLENYIDFGTLPTISEKTFVKTLKLFNKAKIIKIVSWPESYRNRIIEHIFSHCTDVEHLVFKLNGSEVLPMSFIRAKELSFFCDYRATAQTPVASIIASTFNLNKLYIRGGNINKLIVSSAKDHPQLSDLTLINTTVDYDTQKKLLKLLKSDNVESISMYNISESWGTAVPQ